MDVICNKLGFSNWVHVEVIGFSRGIWFLWTEEVSVNIYFFPSLVYLSTHC